MTYEHENQQIITPGALVPIIRAILAASDPIEQDQEHFYVVGLDNAHRIKFIRLATLGLVDQAPIHPREVYRAAIMDACVAVIVAHNHPSGGTDPSASDIDVTKCLRQPVDPVPGTVDH